MCAGKCIKICICPTNCDFHVQHLPGKMFSILSVRVGIKLKGLGTNSTGDLVFIVLT